MEIENEGLVLTVENFQVTREDNKYCAVFKKEGVLDITDCSDLITMLTEKIVSEHIQEQKGYGDFSNYIGDYTLRGIKNYILYIQDLSGENKFVFHFGHNIGQTAFNFVDKFDGKDGEFVSLIDLSDISMRSYIYSGDGLKEDYGMTDRIEIEVADYISKGIREVYHSNGMSYRALVDKSCKTCPLNFSIMLTIEDAYGEYELFEGSVVKCCKPVFKTLDRAKGMLEDYDTLINEPFNYAILPDNNVALGNKQDIVLYFPLTIDRIVNEEEDNGQYPVPICVSIYCGRSCLKDVERHEKCIMGLSKVEYIQIYVEDGLCKSLLFDGTSGGPIKKVSKDDVFEAQSDSLIKLKIKSIIEMAKTIPW